MSPLYFDTRMSQKFCNYLVTWGIVRQLQMLLSRSWTEQMTLNSKISSFPDTLRVLLTVFASMTGSMASEYTLRLTWLCLIVNILCHTIVISSTIWLLYCDYFTHSKCFWLLPRRYSPVQIRKALVHELDYVARSSARLSNHIRGEAMQNMSTHQLPRNYQPQWVPTMAWTYLFTWFTHCKLAHTKILQILLPLLYFYFQNVFSVDIIISLYYIIIKSSNHNKLSVKYNFHQTDYEFKRH